MTLMNILFLFVLFNVCGRNIVSDAKKQMRENNVYEFSAYDIYGHYVPMSNYKYKILLIVNLPPQCKSMETAFKELNNLHKKYSSQGLVILAFPCIDFMKRVRDYSNNKDIIEFAKNKNVKFPIFHPIEVNGERAPALWNYLTSQKKFLKIKKNITGYYTKFIVDRDGNVVNRIAPRSPMSTEWYLKPYFKKKKAKDMKNRK